MALTMAKQTTPDRGFGKHVGIVMQSSGAGRSLARVIVGPEHMNLHGAVHGGVVYSVVDQTMGAATYSVMAPEELCATIEIKVVYLAAVREGVIECESRVLHKGKRVVALESDVKVGDKLVAKALGTFAILSAPG